MKYFFSIIVVFLLATIGVNAQPVVIGHPADTAVCSGGRAIFFVLAVNTIAYQWQENDGVGWYNIDASITYASGYTTQNLVINDANLGLNGYKYRCFVYDGQSNFAVSNFAILGVNEPPVITTQPVNKTTCKNDVAVFSVYALNVSSYHWQESIGQGWVDLVDNAFYSGTKSPSLSIFTTTGMNGFRYRCRLLNGSCPDTSIFARLFVNPTPTLQEVTGGGSYCAGGTGVPIGLANSEAGIAYHLFRNGVGTGTVISGTGSVLNFGIFTQAGTYSVRAINGSTSCAINMLNTVSVVVNPIPLQQQIQGGGSFCTGSPAPEILLSSSELGIKYDLYRNGVYTENSFIGTGFTLLLGRYSETGFYTVRASNVSTACSVQLNGNAQILQNPVPLVAAGNDQTIAKGESAALQALASNGSGGYGYQWQPSAFVVYPQQATTATIPMYQTKLFSVVATDLTSQCASNPDSVMVYVTGGPLEASITSDIPVICASSSTNLIATVSGGSGVYTYFWTSVPIGFTANTAQIVVSPTVSTIYNLSVFDGTSVVTKSSSITVNPLPQIFNTIGGGNYCAGSAGKLVSLSGSQSGVTYSLIRNGQIIASKEGTGLVIDFGVFTIEGTYSATAKYATSQCSAAMSGAVAIASLPKPIVSAGTNQTIEVGKSAILNGSAIGGSGTYSFSWTPASYFVNPNIADPTTVPLNATKSFQLVATDQNSGCQSEVSEVVVFVTGGASVSMQISASTYSICPQEQVQLLVLVSGGSGNYEYQWQSVPAGMNATIYNPLVNPTTTTKYKLTVSDGFSIVMDSLTVQVRSIPQQQILTGGGTYCSGDAGREIILSGSQNSTYYSLWKNGTETGIVRSGTGNPISFGFQQDPAVYQAKAFSLTSLCWAEMTGSPTIQIAPKPTVDAGNDRTIITGATTLLTIAVQNGSGNYSYSWSPVNKVDNPNAQNTLSKPLLTTTTFVAKVTDNQSTCQSNEDEVIVYVSGSTLVGTASCNVNYVCSGQSAQLNGYATGGSGNYSYYWTSIPEGYYTSTQNPIVTPLISTAYVLTVSDGQTIVMDTVSIQVNLLPQVFQLTGGGNICQQGIALPVGLNGSQTGVRYDLFYNNEQGSVINGTGSAINFGLFNALGTYTAKATKTSDGCNSAMAGSSVITNGGAIVVDAGPDKNIVIGEQTLLEGNIIAQEATYTFNWSPANKLENPTAIQPTTKALSATTLFKLQGIPSGQGCAIKEDYVTVFVSGDLMTLSVLADVSVICPGESINLFALPTGGLGNYTYSWTSVPAGMNSNIFNPQVNPLFSTKYKVVVSDGTTSLVDSLFIEVKPAPLNFQVSGGGSYCSGSQNPNINLSGSEAGVQYELFRNNNQTGYILSGTGSQIAFVGLNQNGIYTVFAKNTNSLCSLKMAGNASIEIFQPPIVLSSNDQTIPRGTNTIVSGAAAGGTGFFQYQWNPSYLLVHPDSAVSATLAINQSTTFFFHAVDQSTGCVSNVDTTIVYVVDGDLTATIVASNTQACAGSEVQLLALPGGGSGNYQFVWKNEMGILPFNSASISVVVQQSQYYYLVVNDGVISVMDSVYIEVSPELITFDVTGGGGLCTQNNGIPIGLSGSEADVIYSLFYSTSQLLMSVIGQGNAFSFGSFNLPGVYTVQANRQVFGCQAAMNGSALIQLFPQPVVNAGVDQRIPYGTTTQLFGAVNYGSGSFLFNWQPAASLVNPSNLSPITNPLQASTLFTFSVTDLLSGCSATDQSIVFVNGGALSVDIIASANLVCPGEAVHLTALPSGGSGNYSWAWTNSNQSPISTSSNISVYPSENTKYYVTINDGFETVIDSVLLSVFPVPQVFNLIGGGFWCAGEQAPEIKLSGSQANVAYALLRNGYPTGLSINGTNSAISYGPITANGTYSAIATNQSGCIRMMNEVVKVEQSTTPTLFLFSGGGNYCEGNPAIGMYLSGSEKNTIYKLMLNGNEVIDSIEGNSLPISFQAPDRSGNYSVDAYRNTSNCYRPMQGVASLLIYPIPQVNIEGEAKICLGSSATLTSSGADTYQWLTNPVSNGNILEVSPTASTTYKVIGTNIYGCSDLDSLLVEVEALPYFTLRNEEQQQILYVDDANPADLLTFYTDTIVLQSGYSTHYYYGDIVLNNDTITVLAMSVLGCQTTDSIYIPAAETAINSFSPNGDNINDRFMVGSFIKVYNRWGLEIYSGDEGWDGLYKGSEVVSGTYYYLQEIKDAAGNLVRIEKGSVTLVKE